LDSSENPDHALIQAVAKISTAVNPNAMPRIIAPTDPITVKKPLTAQAQGTSRGASEPTKRNPVENGTPSNMPKGAITRAAIVIRHGRAKPSPNDKMGGIAINVIK
jgi:hypothetical protein